MCDWGPRNCKRSPLGVFAPFMATVLITAACGPATAPSTTPEQPSQPAGPKTLYIALRGEPADISMFGRPTAIGTDEQERWTIFHANLTQFDPQDTPFAVVAQKVPSIQDGDWKVNPDGTMEVTWKIKPGAVWHDGTPLSAEDYAFGYQVVMDPKLALGGLGEILKVSGVRAADAQTVVVTWKETSVWGNTNGNEGIPSLPRHLVQDLYRAGDIPAFESSLHWRDQWVGLGPFRMKSWEVGSHIEIEAFDRYVLGRPKIDRIFLRFIPDPNVVVASVMAGAVDVVTQATSIKPEQSSELKRMWASPEKGTVDTRPLSIRGFYMQFQDPNAPWVRDVRFRQAMTYGMSREENLANNLQYALTTVPHYFVMPTDPAYKLAEQRGLTKYPYDPTRSQRLFAEAGWTKGADGVLRNNAGESIPFRCCRLATADSNDIRESLAMVEELKSMGIQAAHPLPSAPAGSSSRDSREFQNINKEGSIGPLRFSLRGGLASIISENIPRASNGFNASNSGSWSNPTYDGLHARAEVALNPTERHDIRVQMIKLLTDEMPLIPMYYNPNAVVLRKGVEGPGDAAALAAAITWNIHTWDVRN